MGNPRTRGLIFLAVGIVAAWFICYLSFAALPNAGLGVALPVITVPGEVIHYKWIGNFNLTNTLMGGLLATVLVAMWVILGHRATNGWTREVPDRWQAWTETVVEGFYNFCAGLGGENFKKAPLLWPLVAAIFFFLLAGNLGKLLPGVETVGYIHCGYEGFSGYQRVDGWGTSGRLWSDRALFAGVSQTAESEEACQHQLKVLGKYYGQYDPADYEEERVAFYARLEAIDGNVPEEYEGSLSEEEASQIVLISTANTAEPEDEPAVADVPNEPTEGFCPMPVAAQEEAELEGGELGGAEGDDHGEEAEGDDHSEEAEGDDHSEETASLLLTSTLATEEGDDDHGESDDHKPETVSPTVMAAAFDELIIAENDFDNGLISARELELVRCDVTQMLHPGAVFPLTSDELRENRIQPYIFTVAPFFRGVSTDLSFNFGLALLSIIAVQVYGVIALGPAYFEKFINISAIGNLGKKPMGLIDFVVGVIEIISEIGKIVSLAFRLFGNLFAGGIALIIFSFLVAFLVPGIMFFLEIIIGTVQALVFAVLTLVFSVQAMEAHHGDEHDDHH